MDSVGSDYPDRLGCVPRPGSGPKATVQSHVVRRTVSLCSNLLHILVQPCARK